MSVSPLGKATKKIPPLSPPAHLSQASRAWWARVHCDFELDDHQSKMVGLAAEALDRAELARVTLAENGLTYTDRFDAPRQRPEVRILRDAVETYTKLIRQLRIDPREPDTRRPRGLY
jgi:phage terminase small subunit